MKSLLVKIYVATALLFCGLSYSQTCIVTSPFEEGPGTLTDAIIKANNGECNIINFNISPSNEDADTITFLNKVPTIRRNGLIIDGSSESGYQPGKPAVYIKSTLDNFFSNNASSVKVTKIGFVNGSINLFQSTIGSGNAVSQCYFKNTKFDNSSGCNNDRIDSNIFEMKNITSRPISIQGTGNNLKIRYNTIKGGKEFGIWLNGINNVEISDNTISDIDGTSINLSSISDCKIQQNTLVGNTQEGLKILNNANKRVEIIDNYIGTNAAGAYLPNGKEGLVLEMSSVPVIGNKIVSVGVGIIVHSNGNTFSKNFIGTNSSGKNFPRIDAPYIQSQNAQNNLFVENTITNSNNVGIVVSLETNKLSKNKIFNNGHPLRSGRRAIISSHRQIPLITAHSNGFAGLVLSGTSLPNDTIELFVSDKFSQNALDYIGAVKSGPDGNWTLIGAPFDAAKNNYYVATATSTEDNSTSELSKMYAIGDFPEECVVKNTKDDGDESLNSCIVFANKQITPTKITFDIPGDVEHVIELQQAREVNAKASVTIDAGKEKITITKNGVPLKDNAEGSYVLSIRGIKFKDIENESLLYRGKERGNSVPSVLFSNCEFESTKGVSFNWLDDVTIESCLFNKTTRRVDFNASILDVKIVGSVTIKNSKFGLRLDLIMIDIE